MRGSPSRFKKQQPLMDPTKKRLFVGTAALAIFAFTLSCWGFYILRTQGVWGMGKAPYGEEIHQSLRLFLRGSDFREIEQGYPWQLCVGRWLSVGTILFSSILVTYLIFRQSWRELRLRGPRLFPHVHPAALIVNLPEEYRSLIPEFASLHQKSGGKLGNWRPVVVVLANRNSSLAKACERAGLWVIESSEFDGDEVFFRRTGAHLAHETFIFGDNSTANLDLALRCQQYFTESHDPPTIHVQLEDPDLRYALQNRALSKEVPAGKKDDKDHFPSVILPFSQAVNAARIAFSDISLFRLPELSSCFQDSSKLNEEEKKAHLDPETTHILVGRGRWLRAYFAEAIKSSVIDLNKVITLHVCCPDSDALETRLRAEIPEWDLLHADIHFHNLEDLEPETCFVTAKKLTLAAKPASPINIFCLLDDDGDNLSLAARLSDDLASSSETIAARSRLLFLARGTHELGQTFTAPCPVGPEWRAMGKHQETCSLDAIKQTHLTQLAETNHEDYQKFTNDFNILQNRPLGAAMQELSMVIREQNFAQAAHINIKLALLGFPLASQTEPDELITRLNEILPKGLALNPDAKKVRDIYALSQDSEVEILQDLHNFELTRLDSQLLRVLTQLEHIRWNQVHALAGYRYAVQKNDSCRQQPCLRNFDEKFPKDKIPYDIEAVRRLPYLVMLTKAYEVKEQQLSKKKK